MKKATRQQTKEHNRNLVLKTIFDHTRISRAEISRITRLTRTTVSDIVANLLSEGLVVELGIGASHGGKSPILLGLAENSRFVIALDVSREEFRAAVVNLRGKICASIITPIADRVGDEALSLVFQTLDQMVHSGFSPIVGIGVGTPGLVKSSHGMVIKAVNLGWENLPLAELLQNHYSLPVYIINDSQAAAMGEYLYGEGHIAESNLIVINARYGLGAGVIIKGKLFQGDGGGAGEIGHTVVQEGGTLCLCGNHGCLETVASLQALEKKAALLGKKPHLKGLQSNTEDINLDWIITAFETGNDQIKNIVFETAYHLGKAIAALAGALNINQIVIVGDLTRLGQPWLETIQNTMSSHTLTSLAKDTQVKFGKLTKDSVLLGASAVLMHDYSLLFKAQSSRSPIKINYVIG
jgi:predicted NBD/HSP70 family sugar kinase